MSSKIELVNGQKVDMLEFYLEIELVFNSCLVAAYQTVMQSEHFGTTSNHTSVIGMRTPQMLKRWMAG
jgi:hypothetical protein